MIVSLILLIVWLVLTIIHGALSAIPIVLPSQIVTSINYFAGYLGYASGIVDIPGVFAAFNFLLNFMIGWFTFKFILWLYHLVAARRVHEKQALPAQAKR